MRVGVDARALAGRRGVSRYLRELLGALAREHPDDEWLAFAPGRGELALPRAPNVVVRRHPLPGRALFGAAAVAGRPRIDRLLGAAPDVVWAPTIAPMALSHGVPLVLTVQDLSFELRPGDFTAYERVWHRLARPRALARRAARVIVLAPATRGQLVDRWGLDGGRIEVVSPGVDAVPVAGGKPRGQLPTGAYLLAVGALEPRKAPDLLVRAFTAARAQGLRATLTLVGEGRLAGELRADGVTLAGRVDDDALDTLYRGALALVVPSLLEGFGLPLREALARGTPAVVADLPVFGHGLDAAVFRVPPGNVAALTAALLRIEREPGLRAELAAAAAGTVAGLTWTGAARRTRAILAEAAGA